IKDRATWVALLYRSFKEALPEEEVQRLARRAIFEFGLMKAKKDPEDFSPRAWVQKHVDKGSAEVFDSDIEIHDDHAVQQMKFCPLVEAWREMGCTPEEITLFCDIAMEGDRGRAAGHGVEMDLSKTIAKGDGCCRLVIR
ncbi:MAG: L-2-amino-thiazoline-4-carboxylic acid hydrolase, partial [Desulfosarcinaceae bacterium]